MAETRGPKRRSRIQPPMTPMIDCVFQLLVFFLLAPSAVADEAYLTTNLPRHWGPGHEVVPPDEYIRIGLFDTGPRGGGVRIVLNDHQDFGANFDGLQAALERFRRQGLRADFPVLIRPTMATRHKWVVRAFDAAVVARFETVRFAVPGE